MYYLGFDTSNYTTSAALADDEGNTVSKRRLIPVKEGMRGIRQSEGVFFHIKAMPEIFESLKFDPKSIGAVGVSTRPRNVEGSYMPVFLVGESTARTTAHSLGVPLFCFSHQDGHIMAGIHSGNCRFLLDKPFISVHLSGGTTEILQTRFTKNGFFNQIIGKSEDISAGQLIDRIGVKMGLGFPAGRKLEKMAKNADCAVKLPISCKEGSMYFSGTETKAAALLDKNADKNGIALGVLNTVAESLVKAVNYNIIKSGIKEVLFVGGVTSNSIIRNILTERIDGNIYFATPELSSDNAVGIALLAKEMMNFGA